MRIIGYIFSGLAILVIFGLIYIAEVSPATHILFENEIPEKYIKKAKELELLEEGEKMRFFYSDGFLDIEEGFYFLTEDKFGVYSTFWEIPATTVMLEEITYLNIEYDESFFFDSFIYLETEEDYVDFPVSSDRGRDEIFFEFIKQRAINIDETQEDEVGEAGQNLETVDTLEQHY